MTLRQLLTHSEKCSRDLIEHLHATLLRGLDLRELSRPVRRKSNFPTLISLHNSLRRFQEVGVEANALAEHLLEQLTEIHQHAQRERAAHR
jgi:hypothetical protein